MRAVTWVKPDGVMSFSPINEDAAAARGLDDAGILDLFKVPGRVDEGSTDPVIVDIDSVPVDRTFRDAWKISDGSFVVDMPKAREIHLARLRAERNAALEENDKEYAIAGKRGDAAALAAIAAAAQALRDMPAEVAPIIDAIETPEELKAYRPEILDSSKG